MAHYPPSFIVFPPPAAWRCGAGVLDNFLFVRANGPAGEHREPLVAQKSLLHPPVLQRMKTDHRHAGPRGRKQPGMRRKAISSDFNSSFTAIRRA